MRGSRQAREGVGGLGRRKGGEVKGGGGLGVGEGIGRRLRGQGG